MLREQSIRVSDIAFASIDAFDIGERTLVTIHLLDASASPTSEYLWPDYDMQRVLRWLPERHPVRQAAPSQWGSEPKLQLRVEGFASLNFVISMNRGLDHLDIPVRTENLDDLSKEHWEEFSTAPPESEWKPLYQR